MGPSEWLTAHEKLWPLVLPEPSTRTLMSLPAEASWASAKKEIQEVCDTDLGTRLFGFAWSSMLSDEVGASIGEAIDEMFTKDVTPEAVASCKRQALDRVKALSHLRLLPQKRHIVVKYRTLDVTFRVGCIEEEVDLRVQVRLKAHAACNNIALPLPGETQMFGAQEGAKTQVAKELMQDTTTARSWAHTLWVGQEDLDGEGACVTVLRTCSVKY